MTKGQTPRIVSPVPSGPCRRMTAEDARTAEMQARYGLGVRDAVQAVAGTKSTVIGWHVGTASRSGWGGRRQPLDAQ